MAGQSPIRIRVNIVPDSVPLPTKNTPMSLQDIARISCMKVRLPELPPDYLSQLGLLWKKRGIMQMRDGNIKLGREILTYGQALYYASNEGFTDLFLFLKRAIEYEGGSCEQALIYAAEAGNLKAVKLCWEMGIRAEALKAMSKAIEGAHESVILELVKKVF